MATYKQLTAQLEKLHKEMASARDKEVAQAIAEIKEKIAEYGITAEELGFSSKRPVSRRFRPSTVTRKPARHGAAAAVRRVGWPARIANAF